MRLCGRLDRRIERKALHLPAYLRLYEEDSLKENDMDDFDWSSKLNLELDELAKQRGDELLGNPIGNYEQKRVCEHRYFKLPCGHSRDIAIKHYKVNSYFCNTCYEKDIREVAAKHGLTLKSMKCVQKDKREYIMPCGHTIIQMHSYLKKHSPLECQECIKQEVEENLARNGFKFFKKVRDGYEYSCNHCGTHKISMTNTCRFGKDISCDKCYDDRLQEKAKELGFTYLKDRPVVEDGSDKSAGLRWYSCNSCGEERQYLHYTMKPRGIRCNNCHQIAIKAEAALQGMEHLGHVEGMLHKYKLNCGCERLFPLFTIRKGAWACKIHSNTYLHRPSGIYLIRITSNDFSWLKFGYAKEMNTRIDGYGLPEGSSVDILSYVPVETGYTALEVEKEIHRNLADKKIKPSYMKKFMTVSGHTECYPLEMQSTIIKSMEEFNLETG